MEESPISVSDTATASASCWSNVVKNQPPPNPPQPHTPQLLLQSCNSINGVSLAVVDANAIIDAGEKLHSFADKFVSVPEVMDEIRDPVSRHKLSFVPFSIETMEPSPESINKVVKFARATGDLQTLSDVDIKLIALTYTLEAQIHGTKHLRDIPPPVQMVNVKRLPEKELPGWGSNVPNLQEWEALENEAEEKSNSNSRILPLQDLNLNIVSRDDLSVDGSAEHKSETPSEIQEGGPGKPKKYQTKKRNINIEGKKMVADGVDASQGQFDDNAGDWMPAVSRSTHRRFLRRKARREYNEALSNQDQQELEENIDSSVKEDARASNQLVHQSDKEKHIGNAVNEDDMMIEENEGSESLSAVLKEMRLEEGLPELLDEDHKPNLCSAELLSNNAGLLETAFDGNVTMTTKPWETDTVNDQSNHLEIASQTSEATDFSYAADDGVKEDARASNQLVHQSDKEKHIGNAVNEDDMLIEENEGSESLSAVLKEMRLEEGLPELLDEDHKLNLCSAELLSNNAGLLESAFDGNVTMTTKPWETDTVNDQSNHLEIASQTSEATDFSYAADDDSEQSWALRSLSESSVACVTADFAMQNVLLQMGLRLLAPGGAQIHQLHRWILKCHACYTVTAEIGRIFCPKCGNGGTLRKVAVTVGENGIVLAARRPRVTLRGTKFSLPLPKGGRDAVTKNLILREDQLPQRVLYPKTKKKGNKQNDDFFTPDSVFSHHTDKKAPFQPPIRKALAVFGGKRNPNDNHYSRSKHK